MDSCERSGSFVLYNWVLHPVWTAFLAYTLTAPYSRLLLLVLVLLLPLLPRLSRLRLLPLLPYLPSVPFLFLLLLLLPLPLLPPLFFLFSSCSSLLPLLFFLVSSFLSSSSKRCYLSQSQWDWQFWGSDRSGLIIPNWQLFVGHNTWR